MTGRCLLNSNSEFRMMSALGVMAFRGGPPQVMSWRKGTQTSSCGHPRGQPLQYKLQTNVSYPPVLL
jgi:hypothetical protein